MLKYVGKRLIYMVGVFFVVSIIMFGLFNNVPGDRALNQIQAMNSSRLCMNSREINWVWTIQFRYGM